MGRVIIGVIVTFVTACEDRHGAPAGDAAGSDGGGADGGTGATCGAGAGDPAAPMIAGGLVERPGLYGLRGSPLVNPGFEDGDAGMPSGWNGDSAWRRDAAQRHEGAASIRLSNATGVPSTQIATQEVPLARGVYRLSGWIRGAGLGTNTEGAGVRLSLDLSLPGGAMERATTGVLDGTFDWTYVEETGIVIPEDRSVRIQLEAYREPNGTAWFDELKLEEELPPPLDVFLLHPGYRGMLFEDESGTIRVAATVTPPAGDDGAYEVVAVLVDEHSGAEGPTSRATAAPELVLELDGCGMERGRPYLVRVALVDGDENVVGEAPAYRVSRVPAARRAEMAMSFDEKGRVLLSGTPRFLLGVYDSGMAYQGSAEAWDEALWSAGGERRMGDLPINLYLNYWYGAAPLGAMTSLLDSLSARGAKYLQTANCFAENGHEGGGFAADASDEYAALLGAHPGLAGYYTIDECDNTLVPSAFEQYRRLRELDPDGITFAALLAWNRDVYMWRDAADLIATDPYPMYGAEPAGGYPHAMVAEWTAQAREAVRGARPIATVLQFFQFTAQGRWPTRAELWAHAVMAIVEGARGLIWWSLGANALAYVCGSTDEWCPARVQHMEDLRAVMVEIAALEPALLADDEPALLAGASEGIRVKVKRVGARATLFAYNATASPVAASFTWSAPPLSVIVAGENRALQVGGSGFQDTFAPYQAHVYQIE